MADPWFKFFPSDFLGGVGELTAAERGVYITLLAMMYERGGYVDLDNARLARRCGIPAGSFKRILSALVDVGKLEITDEGITQDRVKLELGERQKLITKLQSGAHKTNTIRKEKSEQKQCEDERPANASCAHKPESRSQSKRDTKVSPKKTGSRIGEDWSLSKKLGDWSLSQGMTETEIRNQADSFRDYWLSVAGQKGVKLDWDATWRNWCRRFIDTKQASQPKKDKPIWMTL